MIMTGTSANEFERNLGMEQQVEELTTLPSDRKGSESEQDEPRDLDALFPEIKWPMGDGRAVTIKFGKFGMKIKVNESIELHGEDEAADTIEHHLQPGQTIELKLLSCASKIQ